MSPEALMRGSPGLDASLPGLSYEDLAVLPEVSRPDAEGSTQSEDLSELHKRHGFEISRSVSPDLVLKVPEFPYKQRKFKPSVRVLPRVEMRRQAFVSD